MDGGDLGSPDPTFHGTDMQFVTHAPTPERARQRPSLCPKGFYLRQERGLMIFVALLEQQREEGASGILTSTFFVHKKII